MSDNNYRIVLGGILLVSLYFDFSIVIYVVISIVFCEGITNFRIPKIVNYVLKKDLDQIAEPPNFRISFEAERAFRFTVSGLMMATYPLGPDSYVWFFPWFMGFAILGAGVSGICPALALFKWLGLR